MDDYWTHYYHAHNPSLRINPEGTLLKKLLLTTLSILLIPLTAYALIALPPNQGGTGVSTVPSYGQLLVGNSGGTYTLTATSSLGIAGGSGTVTQVTASSPLTGGTFTTSGSIGCQTASGSQAGCLASADWTTFNNKTNWATTSSNYWIDASSTLYFSNLSLNGILTVPSTTLNSSVTGIPGLQIGPSFSSFALLGNTILNNDDRNLLVIGSHGPSANAATAGINTFSSRGTTVSPTASQAGDDLYFMGARGYGTTAYGAGSKAAIREQAAQNWTDSNQGTDIDFETTPLNSTTRNTNSMVLNSDSSLTVSSSTAALYFKGTSSATSTFAGGLNLTSGCFALNNTCFTVGGGTTGASTTLLTDQNTFSTAGTTTMTNLLVTGTADIQNLLMGSPNWGFNNQLVSTNNSGQLTATSAPTANYYIATSTTATSTFANGLNLTGGCFEINGACFTGGTGSNYFTNSGVLTTLNTGSQLNVPSSGWYSIGGQLLAYASSTNQDTIFGLGAGGQNATTTATPNQIVAIGYNALSVANSVSDRGDIAIGYDALQKETSGYGNIAIGWSVLQNNNPGNFNTIIGDGTGYQDSGTYNTDLGANSDSVGGGNYNTLIGGLSGYKITGSNNIFVGYQSGSTTSSGSTNISIGNNVGVVSNIANNQMNIGNLLFGSGMTGTSTTSPAGTLGIATTSTSGVLNIGTDASSATTTIEMGKMQFDGYNNLGQRYCLELIGAVLTPLSGACIP